MNYAKGFTEKNIEKKKSFSAKVLELVGVGIMIWNGDDIYTDEIKNANPEGG